MICVYLRKNIHVQSYSYLLGSCGLDLCLELLSLLSVSLIYILVLPHLVRNSGLKWSWACILTLIPILSPASVRVSLCHLWECLLGIGWAWDAEEKHFPQGSVKCLIGQLPFWGQVLRALLPSGVLVPQVPGLTVLQTWPVRCWYLLWPKSQKRNMDMNMVEEEWKERCTWCFIYIISSCAYGVVGEGWWWWLEIKDYPLSFNSYLNSFTEQGLRNYWLEGVSCVW